MTGKPKTRDRILMTSLDLFNEEGEPNVTTVDIANEMDISPGNLYYHFHGKDTIIRELYEQFDARIRQVLSAPIDKPLKLEDNWFYLYVVFEEIYAFRFFYRNLTDILQRDPDIHAKFRRLMDLKRKAILAICQPLQNEGILEASQDEINTAAETIVMTVTYWLTFVDLRQAENDAAHTIHNGVFQIMSILAPYFGEQHRAFIDACREMIKEVA
jgi:AcrR family transcriptional regulator